MTSNIFIIILLSFIFISTSSFQENLFKLILESNEDKNVMISPFGIYQVLTILANGAVGQTQNEILETLFTNEKITNNLDILNKINNNIIKILSYLYSESNISPSNYLDEFSYCKGDCNLIFNNVNGLFVRKEYKITDDFSSICEDFNISVSELIDADQINHFCDVHTNGKIKRIIDFLDDNIILILINAIYFKGSWYEPFLKSLSKKLPFQNTNNSIIEVDTMYNFFEKNVMYYENNDIQMISLPYKTEKLNFEMIIILPNKDKYFNSPLNYLKKENINLNELFSKLKETKNVHLYLPKFNYEFNIKLNDILKEMGIKLGFSTQADFIKIFNIKAIKIDKIIQKTFIKVDEEGTEAAAVTMIGMDNAAIMLEEKKEYYMYVNHSFIYAIVSKDIKDIEGNYLIPFIGAVNDIKGNQTDLDEINIDKKDGNYKNFLVHSNKGNKIIYNKIKAFMVFLLIFL